MAVCDVDDSHTEQAAKQFTKNGKAPAKFSDFRKVMERSDVQVIVHRERLTDWHTPSIPPLPRRSEGCVCREAVDADD